MYNTFDPESVSKEDMKKLAEHIEEYIEQLKSVMIIPDDVAAEHGDEIEEGLKRTKKLISKLKKGDRSVFKDATD